MGSPSALRIHPPRRASFGNEGQRLYRHPAVFESRQAAEFLKFETPRYGTAVFLDSGTLTKYTSLASLANLLGGGSEPSLTLLFAGQGKP